MYGIWSYDCEMWYGGTGTEYFYAFTSKAKACKFAANAFGFRSYTEAKRAGWCEVRKLS